MKAGWALSAGRSTVWNFCESGGEPRMSWKDETRPDSYYCSSTGRQRMSEIPDGQ